ncbi:metallophosphoesterase [bacterium]|nr:metallophosphoesterase [bacterium]
MTNPSLKLALIGDPHLAVPQAADDPLLEIDPGRKLHGLSQELLAGVISEINAVDNLSAVVILGDLTRDSEIFNHQRVSELLAGINAPYYLVLGNHDLGLERGGVVDKIYPGIERLDRGQFIDFYSGRGLPQGSGYYRADLPGPCSLIVLDSSMSPQDRQACGFKDAGPDDGWIEPVQLRWLDEQLEDLQAAGRRALVFMHHSCMDHSPAERPGHVLHRTLKFWQLLNAAELNQILRRHGVPAVFSGHLHAQCVNAEDGLVNVVTSATVSYPHAWRLLSIGQDSIEVESRLLRSIPSCPELQSSSREWMAQGMTDIILQKLRDIGPLARHLDALGEMVTRSQWWPRFSDGSLRGFRVDPALVPKTDFVSNLMTQQIVQILNSFGAWQDSRPDPGQLSIPLDDDKRREAFRLP